ncbi:phosphoribosyl-ATP diphosphatase [Clostridium sp. K12(2020)]|nr:phosphoribosyl-ATP diphosphatase [Clostridium sp. K12(2020)]MBX9145096.1 phosphoribosyl-ATP diphosphatase [Clostridium sp. K13]
MVWLVIQVKKVAFLGGLDRVILEELYEIVNNRKNSEEEGSYTKYLLEKGTDKILKKVGEECTEVIIAAKGNDKDEVINEICDLAYHILVLMVDKNIDMEEVENELIARRNKINNFKGERKEIEQI